MAANLSKIIPTIQKFAIVMKLVARIAWSNFSKVPRAICSFALLIQSNEKNRVKNDWATVHEPIVDTLPIWAPYNVKHSDRMFMFIKNSNVYYKINTLLWLIILHWSVSIPTKNVLPQWPSREGRRCSWWSSATPVPHRMGIRWFQWGLPAT